jgi:hypothetical protein
MDKVHRDKPYKITALPLDSPKVKPENKIQRKSLSPWLITLGAILFVMLMNGLIGE